MVNNSNNSPCSTTAAAAHPGNPQSANSDRQIEPLAVSIPEACRITSIKRSSLYRELAAGRIVAVKVGSRSLIPMESLRNWLKGLPREIYGAR